MTADQGSAEGRYRLERVLWEPSGDGFGPRRSRVPVWIEAYVPAPLQGREWRFSSAATAAFSDAQAEVVAAQQHADRIGLATVARQLLRSESMASSQIEGISVPSHRALAKAEVGEQHKPTARAALANIDAVTWAYEWARDTREPFGLDALTRIHTRIAAADRWLAPHAGEIRTRQNWVGNDAATPANAEFVPPPPGEVHALLDDLCGFLNRIDLPPVAQAAIAHVQFETIHPFVDGNGRVGRALIGTSLARSGVCRDVVPPASLVLAGRRDAYVDALTRFRFTDEDPWLLLAAESIAAAAHASVVLANELAALQERWREQARPRKGSAAEEIVRLLPAEPVLTAERVAQLTGRSGEAARVGLNALEDAGVLSRVTVGRRAHAWECTGVFALIDGLERTLSANARGGAATA